MKNHVVFGDCRETIPQMVAQGVRVQAVVTSPPYWSIRDYGGGEREIGMEESPEAFVANIVGVFREIKEILKADGTVWLNIGDCYMGGGRGWNPKSKIQSKNLGSRTSLKALRHERIKPKDLVGVPWMVAFALRDDGWYLRQDIIWHKPSPYPESVTDRCTKAHEYVFLISKGRRYYYDQRAISEIAVTGSGNERRNCRSVWSINTSNAGYEHTAMFPVELAERCILAGTRPGDTVLDPFFGSGTTGEAANNLGRYWIGCELNTDYERCQRARTQEPSFVFEGWRK